MSDYRVIYNSYLLDELHNHFPAILYEPESFRTVTDLMNYVQLQMRLRFDLYSNAARAYRRRQGLSPTAMPVAEMPVPGLRVAPAARPPFGPPPMMRSVSAAAPRVVPVPPVQPVDEVNIRMETTGAESTLNLLSSLLGLSPAPANRNQTVFDPTLMNLLSGVIAPGFLQPIGSGPVTAAGPPSMEPVLVRPTAAQIDAGTAIEIVDAEEEVCAICQDTMEPGSQARNLNACDHRFHITCIDTWFQRNVHCPICRHDVRDPATAPSSDSE